MKAGDLAWSSDEEVADAIRQVHALVTTSQATLFELVCEYGRREAYRADGCRDMAGWLSAQLGLSASTARQWAETAQRLALLPALSALFSAGGTSLDKVAPAARAATPETDGAIAAALPGLSAAGAAALARRAEEVDPADEAEAHRQRHLRIWQQGQVLRLSGSLAGLDGETVRVALERLADRAGADPLTGIFPPREVSLADALVELAGAQLADDADPDRATVVVHVDLDDLADGAGSAETESGVALSAEAARRAACDARLQRLLRDVRTGSVDLGRMARTVSPGLNRYLRRRDGGCRFPGCHARRGVQAHHVVHWAAGGPTDRSNLLLLCRRCHRLVHEGKWTISGDAEGTVTFRSPSGRELSSRPAPLRHEVRQLFTRVLDHAGVPRGAPPSRDGP